MKQTRAPQTPTKAAKRVKPPRVPRPAGEILEHTRNQFAFLARCCAAFDSGFTAEAQNIAHHLRILLHQTGMSSPLLGQVGVMDRLWVLDSAGEVAPDVFTLVAFQSVIRPDSPDAEVSYVPKFNQVRPPQPHFTQQVHALYADGEKLPRTAGLHVSAKRWWNQQVIKDADGREFTRRRLVESVANTDGGSHVDPGLEEDYHALSRLNSAAVFAGQRDSNYSLAVGAAPTAEYLTQSGETFKELGSPVPASIRQIAWELTESVRNQFPHLMQGQAVAE